jgi:regulator of sigma E protease
MGILVFLLAVTLVIAIHELGHYLACRAYGIPVKKFGIGIGKPLLSRTDRHGTEWSIRPFPIGGFVEPEAKAMENASPLQKFVVAMAGPFANLAPFAVIAALMGKLSLYFSVLWTIYLSGYAAVFHILTFGIFATPSPESDGELSGPIGIATMAGDLTGQMGGLVAFVMLFVVLSIGIGLINLIPIPLLDGGRAVLAGVEAVFGREPTKRVEKITNTVGVVIILALIILVTIGDIGRIIG